MNFKGVPGDFKGVAGRIGFPTTTQRKIGGVSTQRAIGGLSTQRAPSGVAAAPAAVTNGDFTYHGGPVITNPIVYPLFLGTLWSDATHQPQATRLTQFLKDMLASTWMNILTQYGAGSGAGSGSVMGPSFLAVGGPQTDAGIHLAIQTVINTAAIPNPPPQNQSDVVMVFLDESVEINDPGLGIVMCEPNGDTAFGYHFNFVTTSGRNCFYSVIPALDNACITNSCGTPPSPTCSLTLGETQEQRRTQVASHEFAEMVTDPIFTTGWWGPASDENGDICNGLTTTITVGPNTWNVQQMYSKTADLASAPFCIANAPNPIPRLPDGPPVPGNLWHTIRHPDGSWQNFFGFVEGVEFNYPGNFSRVGCAGVSNELHVVAIGPGGNLWHTIRHPDSTWQNVFGLVEGVESNNPGAFTAVSCAGVNSDLHLVAVGPGGTLWHTIRHPDGSWQNFFGLVEGVESNNPGAFTAVGCAGVNNELQLVAVGPGGNLWHTIRHADGTWQGSFGLVEGVESNNPGAFAAVACAGVNNEMQLVAIGPGGKLWHTIRHPDGSWQNQFGLVEGVESNDPGAFTAVGCAGVGNEMQLAAVGPAGNVWHTIRHADGSWQNQFGLVEGVESNNPGAFTSVASAGVGSEMQLVGTT